MWQTLRAQRPVLRHVDVALVGPEPAEHPDAPADLLDALAVQRPDQPFAGVDAAAGELELALRRPPAR